MTMNNSQIVLAAGVGAATAVVTAFVLGQICTLGGQQITSASSSSSSSSSPPPLMSPSSSGKPSSVIQPNDGGCGGGGGGPNVRRCSISGNISGNTPDVNRDSLAASSLANSLMKHHGVGSASDLLSCSRSAASKLDVESLTNSLPPHPIWRVAITGGPCSGKSTCMVSLKEHFEKKGFKVFVVPETATILINGGLDFGTMSASPERQIESQRIILQTILRMEDSFYTLAKCADKPSIILCDRGTMDGRAYCSPEQWESILNYDKSNPLTIEELRDVRYDAVIHLVTAAIGAESFYTKLNNSARSETPAQAAALDSATRTKWLGHRQIGVFDNSTDFSGKLEKVVSFVDNLVASHAPGQRANCVVYRLKLKNGKIPVTGKQPNPNEAGIEETHTVEVTVQKLVPRPGFKNEELIRRYTTKADIFYLRGRLDNDAVNYVPISPREYTQLLDTRKDETCYSVTKRHISFFSGLCYYSVTECITPASLAGQVFLQCHGTSDIERLPKEFIVGEEVQYREQFPSILSHAPRSPQTLAASSAEKRALEGSFAN